MCYFNFFFRAMSIIFRNILLLVYKNIFHIRKIDAHIVDSFMITNRSLFARD